MRLDTLISGLDVVLAGEPGRAALSQRICDLTEDSRTVMPGSLFVARRGTKSDGRAFVAVAVKAGAVGVLTDDAALRVPGGRAAVLVTGDVALASAIMAERFYGEPTSRLDVLGVTGTKGKTTTTWLVHQLLNRFGVRCGLIGTVCIDDGSEVAPAALTTPPAMELSRTLARMIECGCKAAAIEVSSHALHQQRAAGLRFRTGVFTNLTHDHLDYHGTMDAYAAAKALLFETLPSESRGGVAIINAHDEAAGRIVVACEARVLRCAVGPGIADADCRAIVRSHDATGMDLEMETPWGKWTVRLPLAGVHNAMNALQAAAAALVMGLAPSEVEAGLAAVAAPPGRLEPVASADDEFAVYVDYAHTPDSLRKVLEAARGFTAGRLIVVFGCGGDRDRAKRPKMGAAAAELADQVFVTSDNPRTEDPGAIIEQIMTGVPSEARARVTVQPDREQTIHLAVGTASAGDVVLIAGKGHEDYQIVGDGAGGTVKRHFDDRVVARAALRARRGSVAGARGRGAAAGHRGVSGGGA